VQFSGWIRRGVWFSGNALGCVLVRGGGPAHPRYRVRPGQRV